MEQTSCGAKLSRAGRSFVHLPLLTELRHVAKGVRLVLQPASLCTQGITAVAVWLCAPSRLNLSWNIAFNFLALESSFRSRTASRRISDGESA